MTNKNLTAIGFVLDRSGSMSMIRSDTIGGFNTFLNTQRESEGGAYITLAQFDNHYEVVHDYVDIKDVPDLTEETFVPRGSTALLDAIGKTVTSIGQKLSDMPEEERPGNVIIAVITDGQENCSCEYTREKVFDMISHQTEVYKWEFVFLGAGKDAIAAGMSMGFDGSKSVSYSTAKMGGTMRSLGDKVTRFRSASAQGKDSAEVSEMMSYTEQDRQDIS